MAELLRTVRLRNQYLIYQDAHNYRVDQVNRGGQTSSVIIPQRVVDYLYQALAGSRVDTQQAELALQSIPEVDLPQPGNYRLKFYAQDVLLVLVALKKATCMDVNHKFIYTVGS
jgi:hypothetical protein